MSTKCYMPDCDEPVHGQGLCNKHHQRLLRQGNPFAKRAARCPSCAAIWKVLSRPGATREQVLDKFTDIWLLFNEGSPYLLKNKDPQGREYDLDIKEEPCSTENS